MLQSRNSAFSDSKVAPWLIVAQDENLVLYARLDRPRTRTALSSLAMQRVLILGATSTIASEVAQIHAGRGDRLHLVGRSPDKLARTALACAGASVTTASADLSRTESNEALVGDAVRALGRIDAVLIAHGDLGDQIETERSFAAAEAVLRTNFLSVVALLIPLANEMEHAGGGGRIGVITSVAGDRGRPRNYTYGTAKGALNIYLQGLRSRLYPAGVSVTTLKLGPVDSPMTRDHKKHALFGKPPSVARDIVRAMDAREPEAYVPRFWSAIMPVVKNTPEGLFQRLRFLSGR
jgi:decaprenylphospho-beta-D-erythro-pentofuranosid-2-ulose 2-reductase